MSYKIYQITKEYYFFSVYNSDVEFLAKTFAPDQRLISQSFGEIRHPQTG